MRIDLKKVNAEIARLRSRLAAIVVMLSFRSLAGAGEQDTEGLEHCEQAADWSADAPQSFETIDRMYAAV
jgi:hypothetical protein